MAIEPKQSSIDVFFGLPSIGERAIGTYIYPLCLFGTPNPNYPYAATEVIHHVRIRAHETMITRMGGLFVQPPRTFSDPHRGAPDLSMADFNARTALEKEVAESFNWLVCELALMGIVSDPVSPLHIGYAQLIDGHALVRGGGGGRESYLERSVAPTVALLRGDWISWRQYPDSMLQRAARLEDSRRLAAISASLPLFIAGAYSAFSRSQRGEALMNSWIVTEQIIDYLWQSYISTLPDKRRSVLKRDTRTFTASVRSEFLVTVGRFSQATYEKVAAARAKRNDLAHRARISTAGAADCVDAMKDLVELVLGKTVAAPLMNEGINW